jgi:copper chaperone CopZ
MRALTRPAALLLLVMWATPADAQIDQATVVVRGMTCNLCAISVEKMLRRVDGVAAARVSLEAGRADITARPDGALRLGDIRESLRRSGFPMGDVLDASFNAMVERHAEGLALAIPGAGTIVVEASSRTHVKGYVGQHVRVRGAILHAGKDTGEVVRIRAVARAESTGGAD